MLWEIRIAGLGVIEDAQVQLHPGLTVLTGETGAGKTMVVQGLGLLLGARADAALVRAGRSSACVEGIVRVPDQHPARERALEAGGELDADELVLARTVSAEGRSRAHVGGRTAPVGVLGELGELLVAVHGQADQWRLRRPEQHRDVVDDYGGPELAGARAAYQQVYAAWLAARAERERLAADDRERTREVDLLTAGLEHIERLDPQPGEDEALRAEDQRLGHAEALRQAAALAHALLAGGDDTGSAQTQIGAGELLARARSVLAGEAQHDPRLAALDGRVAEAGYLVADVAAELAGYGADLDADPARLAWVQDRRAELAPLTRRYGASIDEVLDWGRDAAARLTELLGADERLAALDGELERLRGELDDRSARLTEARREAGARFAAAVSAELAHLAMGGARVHVAIDQREPGPYGADEVEIQLAANSGAPARSVVRAASGGELSRLMLAIEVVNAGTASRSVPTFVFDEVDAGVGGRAARDVGARLAALAGHAQVVVVTHLAQVAAFADRHLVVRKADDGSVTASTVGEVTGDQRLHELARMMGGGATEAGLAHARELVEHADGQRAAYRSRVTLVPPMTDAPPTPSVAPAAPVPSANSDAPGRTRTRRAKARG